MRLSVCGFASGRAEDWQRQAERIPHVNYGNFLYGRSPQFPGKEKPADLQAIDAAMADKVSVGELRELAEHPDTKVRTLALMKSFVSGDPQAFRVIHGRLGDEGLAFPAVSMSNLRMDFDRTGAMKEREVDTEETKVGRVAQMMMGMVGYRGNEDFQTWSKTRLGNPDWLGWYEFLLKRVTQGTQPAPDGIVKPLAEFNQLLDQRPPALRAWLGFYRSGRGDDGTH